MLCENCATSIPNSSPSCPQCGKPRTVTVDIIPPVPRSSMSGAATGVRLELAAPARHAGFRVPLLIWFLLPVVLLISVVWWGATGDTQSALILQRALTSAHSEPVTESSFSVKSHSFSVYKFTVPPATSSVAVNGQFTVAGAPADDAIEVYVMADNDFAIWRNGYSTTSFYESGRVTQGSVAANLPGGAGTYYVVFNNRFSPRGTKTVSSNIGVQYNAWLPDSLFRLKERVFQ